MNVTNQQIADAFDTVADLLEFQQANPFRVRAYRNGARTVRGLTESLHNLVQEQQDLTQLGGIGKDLAGKIETLVRTGVLAQLEELKSQVPTTVLQLMYVPGLGAKKAAALYRELKIETLEQLREACQQDRVAQLKGFGAKTQQTILAGIDLAEAANQRLLWAEADQLAQSLKEHLGPCPNIGQLELAGSYRRGKETVGDLDLLVTADDPSEVMDRLAEFPEVADVLLRGDTKMSVRLGSGFQVDLRVVPERSFGAALQYFTGSKEHNVVLRGRAKQQGLKVNEYGVFRIASLDTAERRGRQSEEEGELVAGATEIDVYQSLGLPWIVPELREGRHEFEWADAGTLPELITLADLRGDLHMHTTASDGKNSLEEMVAAARQNGLNYIAITDHSRRVSVANGLGPEELLAQWSQIDEYQQQLDDDFQVLKGIECDILESCKMDLPDDVLAQADWVVASVHFGQKQSRQQITERITMALEHPYVTAIAHPTGRLLNRRERYEVDLDAVWKVARKHGKLLELNANPRRLDLDDVHCAMAKEHGIGIVINSDAHSTDQLNVLRYGIVQARRAGLTKNDIVNSLSYSDFRRTIDRIRAA